MIKEVLIGYLTNSIFEVTKGSLSSLNDEIKKQNHKKLIENNVKEYLSRIEIDDLEIDKGMDWEGFQQYLSRDFLTDYEKHFKGYLRDKDKNISIIVENAKMYACPDKREKACKFVEETMQRAIDICRFVDLSDENRKNTIYSEELYKLSSDKLEEIKSDIKNLDDKLNNNLKVNSIENEKVNVNTQVCDLIIYIGGDDEKLIVSKETVDEMKKFCREEKTIKLLKVSFERVFENLNKKYNRDDINIQDFLYKYKTRIKAFEYAVEYLLNDTFCDFVLNVDSRLFKKYLELYGVTDFIYYDDIGLQCNYEKVYFQIGIIEELLREFTLLHSDRVNEIAQDNDVIRINVAFQNPINPKWSFGSFIKKDEETINTLRRYGDISIYEISKEDLTDYILPDFYWNLGWLKDGRTSDDFEKISKNEKVFSLFNYIIR